MPGFGDPHARANMIANPLVTFVGAVAHEDIETGFEPLIEALRDLNSFVERVLIRAHSVYRVLGSLEGEIGVKFHHRVARGNQVGAVHLYLIVVLRSNQRSRLKE